MVDNEETKKLSSEEIRKLDVNTKIRYLIDNNGKAVWETVQDELNNTTDPRAKVLLLHLYCEFFMDFMLKQVGLKKSERITNWQAYAFTKKRELIFAMDLIDETMNDDLSKINIIRNNFSHVLNPDEANVLEIIKELSNYDDALGDKLSLAMKAQLGISETLIKLIGKWAEELSARSVVIEKNKASP